MRLAHPTCMELREEMEKKDEITASLRQQIDPKAEAAVVKRQKVAEQMALGSRRMVCGEGVWCRCWGLGLLKSRYTYEAEVIIVVGQQTSCQPELPETSGASGWKVGCSCILKLTPSWNIGDDTLVPWHDLLGCTAVWSHLSTPPLPGNRFPLPFKGWTLPVAKVIFAFR